MDIIETAKYKIETEITDIENRTDLSDDEKRSRIIHVFSVTCAAVAVQPIPFADIFVLTPIQAYMGVRLSAIRGMPLSESEATDLLKEIAGIVGLGMAAQQIALGLYKVGLPGLAGFTTIPLVYGLTYAIGHIMDYYLEKKSKGQSISNADLKKMWEEYRAEGKEQAKMAKGEVEKKKSKVSSPEEATIKVDTYDYGVKAVLDALPEDAEDLVERGAALFAKAAEELKRDEEAAAEKLNKEDKADNKVDGSAATRLSREKAKLAKAWKSLETSYETEEIITGIITGKVKGGFTVELGDIRAFLPGSLVDMRPVRDTSYLEGKELEFKVIKLDQKRNNVVVSRRAALFAALFAE